MEGDHGQLLEPVWSLCGHYEEHKSLFSNFFQCASIREPLRQKPKGSTELKVYYELTFVTLGHLQELVWSFTFFSTSDPISAHILHILHWFFNRKMPLGVLKSIESLLYHWGSIEELNWSLQVSISVCSWKTPFQSKCDNLPQQHLFYTLLYVYSKIFDELGQLYELLWSLKNPYKLYWLGHYSRS